jgi:hypothetical protein
MRGRHDGQECLLLCNGPGLRAVDWKRVDRERFKVFGLNKIHLGVPMLGFVPDYVVAVNAKVIEEASASLRAMPCVKFISNRVPPRLVPADPLTFHVNTAFPPSPAPRFSRDIVAHVAEGWTVTHAALQIIRYMGFARVFIVGMDHHFIQHEAGRENAQAMIEGDDVDHFDPSYFGHGQAWDLPDLRNSEISYRAARDVFESEGRSIVDCSIGGRCTVFERGAIERVYRPRA